MRSPDGVRIIAVFEALKGIVVVVVGLGVLALIDPTMQDVGEQVVQHTHLNPAHHYPRILVDAIDKVDDTQLALLAGLALAYSLLRFVEAYGLWHRRRWAQWIAVASGGIYLPAEIYELSTGLTLVKVGAFAVNIGIVTYMVHILSGSRRAPQLPDRPSSP